MRIASTPRRTLPIALCLIMLCMLTQGCLLHEHRVGAGAVGTGTTSERQYYFGFGLFRVNEVDTQRFTEDVVSYDIYTEMTFFDLILSTVLSPLTITTRTVTINR